MQSRDKSANHQAIDSILIACCKKDYYFTKICVASIRHWYPDIKIQLIKDLGLGDFDTTDMEKVWNVSIFHTNYNESGFGIGKILPLIEGNDERTLVMDCDIIFLGKVLETLVAEYHSIIVNLYTPKDFYNEANKFCYNIEELKQRKPNFVFPKDVFNSGHFVINQGMFSEQEVSEDYLFENGKIRNKNPKLFKFGDQGFLNYFFQMKHQTKQNDLIDVHFTLYGGSSTLPKNITTNDLEIKDGIPYLIHFPGFKSGIIQLHHHSNILDFYEKKYYSTTYGDLKKMKTNRLNRFIVAIPVIIKNRVKVALLTLAKKLSLRP